MLRTAVVKVVLSCLVLSGISAGPCSGSHKIEETECQRKLREINEARNKDPPEIGLGAKVPVCDSDGSYAPKQCSGSQCYCVSRNGTVIGYNVNFPNTRDQTCKCARDLDDYKQLGKVGKVFPCLENGNYKHMHCTGSLCYCIDEDGNITDQFRVIVARGCPDH